MEEINVPSFVNDNYEKRQAEILRQEKKQAGANRRNRIVATRKLLAILAGGIVLSSIPAFRNGAKEIIVKIENHYEEQDRMRQEYIEQEVVDLTGRTIQDITNSGKQFK